MRRVKLACGVFVVLMSVVLSSSVVANDGSDQNESTGQEQQADVNKFLKKLSPDEPLYFAVGWREEWNAAFQLSFKYAFMNADDPVLLTGPFLSRVFFGYTQKSLWVLGADSSPFFDTSYRPGFFYRDPMILKSESGQFSFGWQAGFEHESNGKGGDDSRSLNIVYFEPRFHFGEIFGGKLTLHPRFWYYVGDIEDNPDIADYRGYGQLQLAYTSPKEWQAAALFRLGTTGRGSVQIDLTYPMDKLLLRAFDAYLYLQYFNGWGETLRTYDERLPWQLRIGLAVVRW